MKTHANAAKIQQALNILLNEANALNKEVGLYKNSSCQMIKLNKTAIEQMKDEAEALSQTVEQIVDQYDSELFICEKHGVVELFVNEKDNDCCEVCSEYSRVLKLSLEQDFLTR